MRDFLYLFLAFLIGGLVSGAFGLTGIYLVLPMTALMLSVLLKLMQMRFRRARSGLV